MSHRIVGKSRRVVMVTISFLIVIEAVITLGRWTGRHGLVALVVTRLEARTIVIVARPPGRLSDVVAVDSETPVSIQLGGPGHETGTCYQ